MVRLGKLVVIFTMILIISSVAYAAASDGYSIGKYNLTGSAFQQVSGNNFAISAAFGQFDQGNMGGGNYKISGGYYPGGSNPEMKLFLPFVSR